MPGYVELVPMRACSPVYATAHWFAVHEQAQDKDLRRRLSARHLWGVVARSASSSTEHIDKVWEAEPEDLRAFFMIKNASAVGMATIQPKLPLFRQRLPLPAKLTRNPVLGQSMDVPGPNVAAWNTAEVDDYGALHKAYHDLRAMTEDTGSWTVEPVRSSKDVHTAIKDAGYVPSEYGQRHFDDYESGWRILPPSILYVSPAEE